MVMSSWKKARNALGLHVCVSASSADNLKNAMAADGEAPLSNSLSSSTNALVSPRFSAKLRNSLHISTRSTCAICLEVMKAGHGQALFTAECSHSFHFSCIASNVRYGSLVCPVCRATWKEVPWQAPPLKLTDKKGSAGNIVPLRQIQRRSSSMSPRRRPAPVPDQHLQMIRNAEEEQRRLEPVLRMLDESIANFRSDSSREKQLAESEPPTFDDDEPLESGGEQLVSNTVTLPAVPGCTQAMQITALPEESELLFSEERENLTILVHVKGAAARDEEQQLANMLGSSATMLQGAQRRAAVDLVAVLDISGSMAGSKLTLMKRAMRLVVRSLGPSDRLSIVAFASKAWRIIPLRRMTHEGRRAALEALDTLACTGGTSIADGLRKGTAILQQRRQSNPVATIMLLSDGQDSFTMQQPVSSTQTSVTAPMSPSTDAQQQGQYQIPVHTFGLGVDHDAGAMHTISEESGGTFSFVQGEGLVHDAFAQCLGGLLSVVALRVEVEVEVVNRATSQLVSLEAGSYKCETILAGRQARVHLGDLYAHEERDLLVNIKLPSLPGPEEGEALTVYARYCDPVSGTFFHTSRRRVFIRRPLQISAAVRTPCIEVDRHRNRLQAAHAIVEARALADGGNLPAARQLLEASRRRLQSSVAFHSGDKLSAALDAELARIQSSMGNVRTYQTCGRAYALSAQSSHMRQRATMRGEEGVSEGYRTPCMDTMLVHAGSPPPVSPRHLPPVNTHAGSPPPVSHLPPVNTHAGSPPPVSPRHLLPVDTMLVHAGSPPPVSPRHLPPPSPRRRHILEPRPGSRLARLASFDSVIRP